MRSGAWRAAWAAVIVCSSWSVLAAAEATCSDCEEQTAIVYRDAGSATPIAELWRGFDGEWRRAYELARVPLLVDGRLWEITTRTIGIPWVDCFCVNQAAGREPDDPEVLCTKKLQVKWPTAVGPLPGQERALADTPSDCGGEGGAYAPNFTYHAIFDGLVALSVRGSSNGCGAHTSEWVKFETSALPSGERLPLWTAEEGSAIADAGKPAAVATLMEEIGGRSEEDLNELRSGAMELNAMTARWKDGRFQPEWLLSRSTCYACSNGRWNSYTEAAWVTPDVPLPSPLMPHAALAPALRSLAALVPDAIGFALLPAVSLPRELFAPAARAAKRPTAPR